MNDFPNVGAFATATTTDPTVEITNTSTMTSTMTNPSSTLTTVTLPQTVTTTASGQVLLSKPITLEKLDIEANNPMVSVNLEDLVSLIFLF